MAARDIRRALLSKGYFPKELPPPFTTETFGDSIDSVLSEWEKSKIYWTRKRNSNFKNSYIYGLKHAEAEIISKPKRGYERRNIHIVHPIAQALVALELSENWRVIQKWLARQEYSEDKIRVSNNFPRSLKDINFILHRAKKSYIEAMSDWIIKTDITLFYPSIYTHSIAWAAYGKEHVKSQLKNYQGSLADRLDILIRSSNRNQTVGIPIGPETSRIVAEIISSRIDSEFKVYKNMHSIKGVDRLQDDWVIGVDSLENSENALSAIDKIYRSYGLAINGTKTSVDNIIAVERETWISELNSVLPKIITHLSGGRLQEFLDFALKLQSKYRSEPVINYALSMVENIDYDPAEVEVIESFLLKAAIIAPNSMDKIGSVFLNLQYRTNSISKQRVKSRIVALIERHLEKGDTYEAIWLLFTLRGLKIRISSKKISDLSEFLESSIFLILLMDMENRGIWMNKLPKTEWEKKISSDSIRTSWNWLLAYEGFRNGWLSDTKGLMRKSLFNPLRENSVAFFDPRRNVKQSWKLVKMRRELRKDQQIEMRQLIQDLRSVIYKEY